MKGLLIVICVIGAVIGSQTARISFEFDRALKGNECKGHPHGDLIPYPGDCGKYLVCEYFNGTVMLCPSGLHFNPILKVCDWPTSAGCNEEGGGEQPPPTTTPEPGPTLKPDDDICVGKENGDLAPFPYDCDWYIRCEEGSPLVLRCAEGKQFNAILLICDYPENVHCIATPYPTTTVEPPSPPPTQPPTEPPTQPPTQPPTEPPTEPPTQPPTEPPTEPPTQPPTESPSTTPETVPTLNPDENVCAGKENGDLAPFPYDCDWYIRCEEGSPLVLRCAEGKQFNAILLICDYPENVHCVATPYPTTTTEPSTEPVTDPSTVSTSPTDEPSSTPSEPVFDYCIDQPDNTLLKYPCNCTWYIRCVNNNAHFEQCKDGRVFNSVLQICDFPENTECNEEPYPSTANPTDPSIETTTPSPTEGSTNPPYVGTGICQNIERGTFLPYPGRCDLFIVCIEPAPTTFSCPSGLEFNPEARYCQEAEVAGCSIPKTTTVATTTTETTEPIPPGICSTHPIGDLIPYPGNCSQYIKCDKPIPTAEECPIGLEFNPKLQLCESAEDAGCSCPVNTPEPPTTTPSTPTEGSGICEDREDGELVAYPGDCNKFIICKQPIPSAGKCGDDLIFNSELGICDEPTDTECVPSTLPPPTEHPSDPELTGVCRDHQNGELIAYPDSCNKFIRCQTPVPIAGTCEDGLLFNEILGICDTSDSVYCPGNTPSPGEPGEGTTTTEPPISSNSTNGVCKDHKPGDLIPYPEHCDKYIECKIPVPYARTCENGFHFNAKLAICDDPETAECEIIIPTTQPPPSGSNICCGAYNGSLVAYPDDCTQYIQCIYPIPIALQCDDGLHYNAISQECESVESAGCEWYIPTTIAPVTCEDKEDGTRFAYSGDCKKYYLCSDGEPVLLPCTIGAVFDPTIGNCVPGDVCP